MTPFAAPPDYPHWVDVARLIHDAFAYMTPILGHEARALSVTDGDLRQAARHGTGYLIESDNAPIACAFTRPSRDMADALYLGWLAVDDMHRGKGLAQTLIQSAEAEARTKGYAALTLDTGRALVDLHGLFHHTGFVDVPGTDAIITFRKTL